MTLDPFSEAVEVLIRAMHARPTNDREILGEGELFTPSHPEVTTCVNFPPGGKRGTDTRRGRPVLKNQEVQKEPNAGAFHRKTQRSNRIHDASRNNAKQKAPPPPSPADIRVSQE